MKDVAIAKLKKTRDQHSDSVHKALEKCVQYLNVNLEQRDFLKGLSEELRMFLPKELALLQHSVADEQEVWYAVHTAKVIATLNEPFRIF